MLPGEGTPSWPLNIVADFAGGGLLCATGILLALLSRATTGHGQVVNTDMVSLSSLQHHANKANGEQVSGARYVASFPLIHNYLGQNMLGGPRGTNVLDGGAPFYGVYTCKDGGWISVGCLEPQFFKIFLVKFLAALPNGFDPLNGWRPDTSTQFNPADWPKLREFMTHGFLTQSRDSWAALYQGDHFCRDLIPPF